MKISGRWVLFAALLAGGCSGGGSDGGSTGPGGGTPKSIAMVGPAGTLVNGLVADTNGLVFVDLGGGAETIKASSPSGTLSTVLTAPAGVIVLDLALDGQTVYYLGASSGTYGVYSVPRAGGTPTTVTTAGTGQLAFGFALDDTNVYLSVLPQGASSGTGTGSILQAPRSSGAATTIYTAPSGQFVDHLLVDSGTLYWSETDKADRSGAAAIRSATVGGGSLSPTTLLSIPAPSGVFDLKVTGGWILGAKETASSGTITVGTGVFAVPSTGGTPVVVDSQATAPIAIGPGVVFLNRGNALAKATVSASGFGTPSVIASGVVVVDFAADEQGGTLYYISPTDGNLYKL